MYIMEQNHLIPIYIHKPTICLFNVIKMLNHTNIHKPTICLFNVIKMLNHTNIHKPTICLFNVIKMLNHIFEFHHEKFF